MDAISKWMNANGESIVGTTPGLEPWQFYGPSTRRGNERYLHLVMRPYETVSVRGVKVSRIKSVKVLKDGRELEYDKRTKISDMLLKNPDPMGEITITTPSSIIDEFVTVLVMDLE